MIDRTIINTGARCATKQALLKLLAEEDPDVLAIAYVYAKNFKNYGEDVTKVWDTVIQQSEALKKAYYRGYYAGRQDQLADEHFESLKKELNFDSSLAEKFNRSCKPCTDESIDSTGTCPICGRDKCGCS